MDTFNSFDKLLVVMGGGIREDGKLPSHVESRCQAVLIRSEYLHRTLVICSSSFTLNRPPKLTPRGFPRSEASAMASWLSVNGYTGPVACEQLSHDTVGSVFFVLSLYGLFLEVNKIEFITSEFHAKRVSHIADFVNERVFSASFNITVTSVPDDNVNADRIVHEEQSLLRFNNMFGFIRNRMQFVECLFIRHSNYNHLFGSDVSVVDNLQY
jgi:hypothetical protein